MSNLGKYVYTNIIYEFNNKNINELLKLIQKYKKPVINSIIRLTIINTQNFNYAIELNDNTNSTDISNILQKIFKLNFKKIDYIKIKELYENSILKKDIINHELFKKFKHLFSHELYNYKLICFYVFNNNLLKQIIIKQQSFTQLNYHIRIMNLNEGDIKILLKLLIENKVNTHNIYINKNIISVNNYKLDKTFDDIQLESLLLIKLSKYNITKENIIDVYETCNINNETKKRTKILIKLLCKS